MNTKEIISIVSSNVDKAVDGIAFFLAILVMLIPIYLLISVGLFMRHLYMAYKEEPFDGVDKLIDDEFGGVFAPGVLSLFFVIACIFGLLGWMYVAMSTVLSAIRKAYKGG